MTEEGTPTASISRSPVSSSSDDDDADEPNGYAADDDEVAEVDDAAEDDGFGDDFDDFEEGGDGDDFGDFDDGFQQGEQDNETTFDKPPEQASIPAPSPGPVSRKYAMPGFVPAQAPVLTVMHWLTGLRVACP